MRLLLFILGFIACGAVHAAPTCDSLFAESSTARSSAHALGVRESESFVDRLLFYRLEKKWNPRAVYTPAKFEERIEQSYDLLTKLQLRQGLLDHRSRDFHANPDEVSRWAEQALLRQGLRAFLDQPSSSQIQKLKLKVQQLLETPVMKSVWSLLTLTLPPRFNKDIPPALLAKITVEGIDAHLPELQRAYKQSGQERNEHYRRVRKALRYLVLSVNLLMVSQQIQSVTERQPAAPLEQQAEAQKHYEQMMTSLDQLESAVDDL